MVQVRRVVLDVLKPHHPDILEFGRTIAACGGDYRVGVDVVEMDDHTQTVVVTVEGSNVVLEDVSKAIADLSASVHSIDGVEVWSDDTA